MSIIITECSSEAPEVNQLGDEVNRPVIIMQLKRETIDKINWDSFSIEDFENVADYYQEDAILNQY